MGFPEMIDSSPHSKLREQVAELIAEIDNGFPTVSSGHNDPMIDGLGALARLGDLIDGLLEQYESACRDRDRHRKDAEILERERSELQVERCALKEQLQTAQQYATAHRKAFEVAQHHVTGQRIRAERAEEQLKTLQAAARPIVEMTVAHLTRDRHPDHIEELYRIPYGPLWALYDALYLKLT
jgi:hypothetical protein